MHACMRLFSRQGNMENMFSMLQVKEQSCCCYTATAAATAAATAGGKSLPICQSVDAPYSTTTVVAAVAADPLLW